MICPNCRNQVVDEADFCSNCGVKLNKVSSNANQPFDGIQNSNPNIEAMGQPQYISQQFDNNVKNTEGKKKTLNSSLIIVLVIILFLIGGFCCIGIKFLGKDKNINNNSSNNNLSNNIDDNNSANDNPTEELQKSNTLEKLKEDYASGVLNVNDYFTQLVYLEFDSSKLDSKYSSDYEYYITGCELETDEILENNYDALNQDIIRYYLTNKTMANVILGGESVVQQANYNIKYKGKLLKASKGDENAANHRLDKVYLSKNRHFLIWYTDYGDDAITDEQLKLLADGLESSIKYYEQYFGIEYSYSPYIDNQYFNDDWDNAKKVLTQNHLSTSILKTAMSVYVYNTGSDAILASYTDETDASKLVNRSLIGDILDDDGIVNYPYIVINKSGFSKKSDSLIQLYNHELFHHMQYLFCKSTSGKRCVCGLTFKEGMANLASSKVSNSSTTNNYLNNWAGIYTQNTSTKLSEIADANGVLGYGMYTYFYSYSTNATDWAETLMNAHNKSDPFTYIRNNTSKQDLVSTINDVVYYSLSQSYDNKALISNMGINFKAELKNKKIYNLTINAGAIDYFEINQETDLTVSAKDDYLTAIIYGYKDGKYTELKSSSGVVEIDIDTAFYVNYDKFYLAVTNGDLIDSCDYTINVRNSKYLENSDFVTTFNNYNIEMTMKVKTNGIEVAQHSKGIVDELHQKEYLDFETTTMGTSLSNKIYYDFNSGYTYMTQPYGGDVWWKEKGTSQKIDLGNILDKLINMENVTKVSDNHYKVKMAEKDIKGLMGSANSSSSIKGGAIIDVYTDNGYIVKLEYDFTKIISGVDLFTATIKLSNYNNAGDVEIPKTIVENSKEM